VQGAGCRVQGVGCRMQDGHVGDAAHAVRDGVAQSWVVSLEAADEARLDHVDTQEGHLAAVLRDGRGRQQLKVRAIDLKPLVAVPCAVAHLQHTQCSHRQ
jgi:hypothetical protein